MDAVIKSGDRAPEFDLADLEGKSHRLADGRGRVVVLNFWSATCPWVHRTDEALVGPRNEWGERVAYWPIASNADETLAVIRKTAAERNLSVVLHDVDQHVADSYGALITPQFFVIDPEGLVRYTGALDDVTFRKRTPSRIYLAEAVSAVLEGRPPEESDTPAYGCALVRIPEATDHEAV
jgi:peroxiredoxin